MLLSRTAILGLALLASCNSLPEDENGAPLFDPAGAAMTARAPDQYRVLFETSRGDFVVEVSREWAPLGADRFYNLVRHGFYDGARFFRVIPGFVVQFGIPGDPALTTVWDAEQLPDDPVQASNLRGYLSFATAGPDTRTTQVFINLADNSPLDQMGFAPFAWVESGMEVVDSLFAGYGEGPPMGRGPIQARIEAEGTPYLEQDFPDLDYIHQARLLQN